MRTPGQMLRNKEWLIAIHHFLQPLQMLCVNRCDATNRQANTVHGKWEFFPYRRQPGMSWPAGSHEIFCMHLEEGKPGCIKARPIGWRAQGQRVAIVSGLQTHPDALRRNCLLYTSPSPRDS